MNNEYRVHVQEDWPLMGKRLLMKRAAWGQPGVHELLYTKSQWVTVPAAAMAAPFEGWDVGLLMPDDAWDALGELIVPQRSAGEVARLEEALALERNRVDRMLGRAATFEELGEYAARTARTR